MARCGAVGKSVVGGSGSALHHEAGSARYSSRGLANFAAYVCKPLLWSVPSSVSAAHAASAAARQLLLNQRRLNLHSSQWPAVLSHHLHAIPRHAFPRSLNRHLDHATCCCPAPLPRLALTSGWRRQLILRRQQRHGWSPPASTLTTRWAGADTLFHRFCCLQPQGADGRRSRGGAERQPQDAVAAGSAATGGADAGGPATSCCRKRIDVKKMLMAAAAWGSKAASGMEQHRAHTAFDRTFWLWLFCRLAGSLQLCAVGHTDQKKCRPPSSCKAAELRRVP